MEIVRDAYTNYSAMMNRDMLYENMKQVNEVASEEAFLEDLEQEDLDKIAEQKEINQEEAVALYFNYQFSQSEKNAMEILMQGSTNSDEEELSYSDINEFHEQQNINSLIEYYANNSYEQNQVGVEIRA